MLPCGRADEPLEPCELPPLFPGMEPASKPSFVNIAKLARQTNKSAKTKSRGLPRVRVY